MYMSGHMTSKELCACHQDRNELFRRATAGEGVLALLVPLAETNGGIELRAPRDDCENHSNGADSPPASTARLAQRFIRLRRKRDSVFGDRLFADPAWDMMLDLFQASEEHTRPVSITSLCIASAVPNTTALRWIDALVQKGLLTKEADERDGRRTFVKLTEEAKEKMQEVLSSWA
jgi:DNA-binding MarR family transcriptional regulator